MSSVRDRGTGRTTSQMVGAPRGAVFVWCTEHLIVPKQMARKLGREDLIIVGPEWISQGKWAGLKISGLVLDHYLYERKMPERFWDMVMGARARVRSQNAE